MFLQLFNQLPVVFPGFFQHWLNRQYFPFALVVHPTDGQNDTMDIRLADVLQMHHQIIPRQRLHTPDSILFFYNYRHPVRDDRNLVIILIDYSLGYR